MYDGQIMLAVVVGGMVLLGLIGMVNGGGLGTRACIGARRVVRPVRRAPVKPVLSRAVDMTRVVLTLACAVGALAALAYLVR